MGQLPLFARLAQYGDRTALIAARESVGYGELRARAARVAAELLEKRKDLEGERVALLVPPTPAFVEALLGIWAAGGVAVPLGISHPPPELEYVLEDSGASAVIASAETAERIAGIARERGARLLLPPEDLQGAGEAPSADVEPARPALVLYTSGTTGRPKGVVHSHGGLAAQVESLSGAWGWSAADRILLVLPLHHVHGLVNVVLSALWNGAACAMLPRFEPAGVWEAFTAYRSTLFMAVPTVYAKLVTAWEEHPAEQARWSAGARKLRLMVSGSAALPVSLFRRWREITGHTLLERYGMTEFGMALSNPLHGERVPGTVGVPLPGVRVRIVGDRGDPVPEGEAGELEVQSPGMFAGYWRRPAETRAAFRDGWFRTGDMAICEGGRYRLLGRRNVDIIKTGGYKVSALEIEEVVREHPDILECAVVGIPDAEWGERVCAAVVARGGAMDIEALRRWVAERLAPYKVPSRVCVVEALPRNAMGKVVKSEVRRCVIEAP